MEGSRQLSLLAVGIQQRTLWGGSKNTVAAYLRSYNNSTSTIVRETNRRVRRVACRGVNHVASRRVQMIVHSVSKQMRASNDVRVELMSRLDQSASTVPHSKLLAVETSGQLPSCVANSSMAAVIIITAWMDVSDPRHSSQVGANTVRTSAG